MPITVIQGDFLSAIGQPNSVVVAPTNGVLTPKGLVMGAGAASALAQHQPLLRELFAQAIRQVGQENQGLWKYGFVAVELDGQLYGAFQTKLHFNFPSTPNLLRYSAQRLQAWMDQHPNLTVHLAFPGIGLGGMRPEEVLQILEESIAGEVYLYRLK